MDTMEAPESGAAAVGAAVPYVAFPTLQRLLNRMAEEGGPPNRVDRSYLTGMSGGYQSQVIAALRILKLIDDEGAPTSGLVRIVDDLDGELAPYLQQQVNLLYPEMIVLANKNGTAKQLADAFREKWGVSGSTLSSAVRFYLEASKFAGLPVGTHFRAPSRSRGTGTKKVTAKRSPSRQAPPAAHVQEVSAGPSTASTLRVGLASGGSIMLTTAVDLVTLSPSDRTFVFELIDSVKAYDSKTAREQKASSGAHEDSDRTDPSTRQPTGRSSPGSGV